MTFIVKTKLIIAASFALFILACNNDKSKKLTTKTEVNLENITQEEKNVEPPPPPPPTTMPPKVEMLSCYANDGLKYKTVINIIQSSEGVKGNVSSEEYDSGKKEVAEFTGIMDGNKLTVKFKGKPPVIGDASEWTDKPWRIEKVEGKGNTPELLYIIFKAKDHETNKWKDTEYIFAAVDCK